MENPKADGQESAIFRCNKLAMEHLKLENYTDALSLLRQAESILNQSSEHPTEKRLKLLAITLNNLGCYYKRRKQPNVALRYLVQALQIEQQHEHDPIALAGTQLNVCAIYSQLGKHSEALKHAYDAFKLLENAKERKENAFQGEEAGRLNAATTLVIAYHNVAVELEFMRREPDAVEFYRKGAEVATLELGSAHPLSKSIAGNEEAARLKVQGNATRSTMRQQQREENRVTSSRRARSKVSEATPKLPPMRHKDHSFTYQRVKEQEEVPGIPQYRLASAPDSFHSDYRLAIEDGIAGTRKFVSPRTKLQAYLH